MAAGLPLVLVAVLGLFGAFMGTLAYGQWMTRDVVLVKSTERHPRA
ncbi:hypothetical protein [Devosia sp. SL43]|nr:hypothetical protein [Devosia sp. SL43]UJW84920.1 hypothetical protein IM737_16070 [Devosia sp. SL43]